MAEFCPRCQEAAGFCRCPVDGRPEPAAPSKGDRVSHAAHGLGTVVATEVNGRGAAITTVEFDAQPGRRRMSDADGALTVLLLDAPPAPEGLNHRGQLRMAERFARQHVGRLVHVHGIGWHLWDGTRWALDRDGAAMRAAVETVKATLREVADLSPRDREELLSDVRKCETAAGMEGVLRIAAALRPLSVAADRLDADPYLVNTTAGTLDLRTGDLRPHDPADLITRITGCGLGETAEGTAFGKFVAEVLPDAEVREFVQRLFGYAMLGAVREHVLPIFMGVGQNGKSTLLDVVADAFGDYAIAAEPEMLIDRGNAHPTGQADLLGARLAVCAEIDEGRRLAAATVKRLTGGDKIRARRMRQDFFEFDPTHVVILVTNHKPKVSGDDPALWRRIRVVPFDVVVGTPDPKLPERLALELPAVLRWAYDGYRAYAEHGLGAPAIVTERTAAYRAESDALARFLEEYTVMSSTAYVRARDLFAAWARWCQRSGEQAGTEPAFAEAMTRHGFERKRRSVGQIYVGVALAVDDEETP